MSGFHVWAVLTGSNGKTTRVMLHLPAIPGGLWSCSYRADRGALCRLGYPETVETDRSYRVVDKNGHTMLIRYGD